MDYIFNIVKEKSVEIFAFLWELVLSAMSFMGIPDSVPEAIMSFGVGIEQWVYGIYIGILDFVLKVIELFSTKTYMENIWYGLGNTVAISVLSAILGLVLGTVVALISIAPKSKWLAVPKAICKIYITIIRGTPMALQLFIMFYVVFTFRGFPELITATLAFGINSGAYVAENIRGGIMSVDIGQTEAGRALGLSHGTTMMKIVIPQAIKNVIPAIGNELIALIKETSIVSMVGMFDLTMAAKIIGSGNNMASYIVPMAVVALFYLGIVYLLTFAIKMIERRLRASDKR